MQCLGCLNDAWVCCLQVSAVVPELCVLFHESVQALSKAFLAKERRHVYITPTSYLELIHSYKTLLSKKQNEVSTPMTTHPAALAFEQKTAAAKSKRVCLLCLVVKAVSGRGRCHFQVDACHFPS